MTGEIKNIAIIGANKEALALLPVLVKDSKARVRVIADSNKDAMLFKLNELGYRVANSLDILVTNDLNELRRTPGLDIIINALQDQPTEKFLEAPEFRDVEKLGPLSARLVWGLKASAAEGGKAGDQTALLASFREIVDAVRLTTDRKELLSVILRLATESSRAERGSIMLISPEDESLHVEIAKGMDEEVVRKIRVPLGEGISGRVAKEGKPMLISGKARGAEFASLMERSDVKSSMCVPLIVSGKVIGIINVSSNESSHSFTEEDLDFLSSLSGLAAEVIHRSNEYEKLRVDSAKFTFWKEIDAIMSSSLPLDNRLTTVARKLVNIFQGLTCFIYIFDEDRNRLFLKAASTKDAKGIGLLSLRPGEGMEGSGIDCLNDLVLIDRSDGKVKRAYLTLPMVSHGVPVGTLNVQIVSSNGLSVYQEAFLKDIRNLIADSVYKYKQTEKEKLKSRKMFAVDESGIEMISIRDTRRLATIIATTPAAILGAEGSLLRLKQGGKFQTIASFGLDDKNVREYFLPIEKETVTEVLRKKEPVMREFSEEASPYVRSIFAYPLKMDTDIVGVLSFFNKTEETMLYPYAFSKSDRDIMARFAVYVEKALLNLRKGMPAAQEKKKEEVSSTLSVFEERAEQELNRARRLDKGLVVATIRVAGLKDAFPKNRAEFEGKLIDAIKRRSRNFDVIVRLNEETFGFLFLDTNEKITRLVGAITEFIASDAAVNRAFMDGKADIHYGFATFPTDGDSFETLFAKASNRVRLNLNKAFGREL